jgi:hypothetical protein
VGKSRFKSAIVSADNAASRPPEAVAALPAPERLQARVGIATGLVVAGDLADASPEHEVVGEASNFRRPPAGAGHTRNRPDREHTRRHVGATFALR